MNRIVSRVLALLVAATAAATLSACDPQITETAVRETAPATTTLTTEAPSIDDLYLQVLHEAGVATDRYPLGSDSIAVRIGREVVCEELRDGTDWRIIGLALIREGLSAEHAGTVVGAANSAFCPDVAIDYDTEGVPA